MSSTMAVIVNTLALAGALNEPIAQTCTKPFDDPYPLRRERVQGEREKTRRMRQMQQGLLEFKKC